MTAQDLTKLALKDVQTLPSNLKPKTKEEHKRLVMYAAQCRLEILQFSQRRKEKNNGRFV